MIPIVDTIIEKDGKILMLRRNHFPENKLDLLGGYVDDGETPEETAIREVKEESGLKVKLGKKLSVYDYEDRGSKQVYVFVGTIIGGEMRASSEGVPEWADPRSITADDLAFPQVHIRVLEEYNRSR